MTEQEIANQVAERLEYAAWKGFNQSESEFEKGYKHAMEVAAQIVREHFGIVTPPVQPSERGKKQ